MSDKADKMVVYKDFRVPAVSESKYRLLFMNGEKKGTSYLLSKQRIVIGRSPDCDIPLDDTKASREHAELVLLKDNYVITDLKSQNGVLVNDLKITQVKLKDGDQIVIGKSILKFHFVEARKKERRAKKIKVKKGEEKKIKPVFIVVILLALLSVLLLDTENEQANKQSLKRSTPQVEDPNDDVILTLEKKRNAEDREVEKKLQILFQKGLRELREGNYFRAMEEFDSALVLSPRNSEADHYMKVAKEHLRDEVSRNFVNGTKDRDALRYEKSISSFCNIIRLLQNYPEDTDYLRAQKHIKAIEKLMNKDEDEIKCLQK